MSRSPVEYSWDVDDVGGYANAMGRYKTALEGEFLQRHLGPAPLKVLDIGGGSGRFAERLVEGCHSVTVSEVSMKAVELLKARCPDVRIELGDFLDYRPTSPFDLVVGMESFMYFRDVPLATLLERVTQALKPDGRLVCTMLNPDGWRTKAGRIVRRAPDSYHRATPAEMAEALKVAGFVVEELEGFMWLPVSNTSDSALVAPLAALERWFRLRGWLARSPWYLVAARRLP